MRFASRPLLIAFCLLLFGPAVIAGLRDDLYIPSTFNGLNHYGTFEKHVTDKNFKGDVATAQRMVPGSVMDRLGGRYPNLFRAVSFGDAKLGAAPEGGKRLVIEGDLPQVAAGSFMKRSLIGFGAGRVQLAMNIRLVDGASGQPVATLEMKSLNWGAAWQSDEGELEDMVDRMAADFVYYLVNQHNPSYKSGEEEVR